MHGYFRGANRTGTRGRLQADLHTMAATPPPSAGPSDTVRAAVTCGLVLYLAGLLLALAGNTTSGSSLLVRTIKSRIYAPLFVPAWLDLGFDNHLTWGTPADADHTLEIGRRDAGADGTMLRFPDGGVRGERAARWRRLARAIAAGNAAGESPAVLAAAAAAGTFATIQADDVNLRVMRTPPGDRETMAPARPERAYQARVRQTGDDIQLIKGEDPSELAPLARPRPASVAPDVPAEAAP
jgi:hypothetical protein